MFQLSFINSLLLRMMLSLLPLLLVTSSWATVHFVGDLEDSHKQEIMLLIEKTHGFLDSSWIVDADLTIFYYPGIRNQYKPAQIVEQGNQRQVLQYVMDLGI